MTAWNDFQRANAGQGLSQQQMSAMYRASGGGAASSSSSSSRSSSASSYSAPPARVSTSSSSSWNSFQQEVAGQGFSRAEVSSMYHANNRTTSQPQPTARPATTTSSSTRSAWNDFQRAYAGQGMTSADMSAAYRAQQNTAGDAAARRAAAATAATQRSAAARTAPASARPASASSTTSSQSGSTWNEFQRAHAGQGLSATEMSAGYRAEQQSTPRDAASRRAAAATTASARATQAPPSTRASATPRASSSTSSTGSASPWNEFQRQHAGQGLSKRQLSLLYKHEKAKSPTRQAGSPASARTNTTTTSATSTKAARAPNAFNEFQKKYKEAHPEEKLSAAQLAKIYRQEKLIGQRDAHEARYLSQLTSDLYQDESGGADGGWSNAMDELLEERRQELAELMLEIAMRQEQLHLQADSTAEYEEWGRVAQQLEAEEGNLNRKAYVNNHEQQLVVAMSLEDPAEHARHAKSLKECEVIDLSRLELSVEEANRIGSGAFGTVYTGTLDSMIPVAVKVVDGVSARAKARFEQELLAMMRASAHENVLRVYGYAELTDAAGRQSFGIVMELMVGGDLAFALHDEAVTLEESDRLDLLLQVIISIEYLHSDGVTHRDIKPQNVLLSSDSKTAKLADFGLAGVKNTTLGTRQSHVTQGNGGHAAMGLTPAYAAPEVIEGKLSFRDMAWKKSDVFSFTVMLAQVLMDEQPWEFESPQFILNSVSKQAKRPFEPDEICVSGSRERNATLHSLVRNGWHQDPALRPTATEMRERLEKIIAAGLNAAASSTKPTAVSSPRGVDSVWSGARNARQIFYEGDEFFDAA